MDWDHRFGAGIRCTGMAIAKEKQGTVSYEECINPAFLHYNCSSFDSFLSESPSEALHCIFSPIHPCLYIYIATFHSRSISNRYGSVLSAVAMSRNIPLQGSLFGLRIEIR